MSMSLHHKHPECCSSCTARGQSCSLEPGGLLRYTQRSKNLPKNYAGEDLELPLPLRSDEELNDYRTSLPSQYPHHVQQQPLVFRGRPPIERKHNYAQPPADVSHQWAEHHNWIHSRDSFRSTDWGCVSVNVPQFSVPPADVVSEVGVAIGAESPRADPREKRRTIRLPNECRNIFITYSSDSKQEMVPLVEFLTKQRFKPAIDYLDGPVRRMDVNLWQDSFLKDPSTLIIVAVSPKYKADIEGSGKDPDALQTKYIHTMMQQEFIQQGSLNYRFIPVLFLNATQRDVPGWLQNTQVYRWPQDTEDLLLHLLREERFVPPPVPTELSLIIRPMTVAPVSSTVGP